MSSKSKAYTLLNSDDESDSSVVLVSPDIAPKTPPTKKIAKFGSIDSDEEVVVTEKKRKAVARERSSPSKVRMTTTSSSPSKLAAVQSASVGERNTDTFSAGSSMKEDGRSPTKTVFGNLTDSEPEGTSVQQDSSSKSSLHVKDLTKGNAHIPLAAGLSPGGTRRTPRTPKLTERAKYSRTQTPTKSLNEKLGALSHSNPPSSPEGDSDVSYRPTVTRNTSRAKGKSRRKPVVKEEETEEDDGLLPSPMKDVQFSSMRSPDSSSRTRVELRPLTDTDDGLPSPSAVLEARSLRTPIKRRDQEDTIAHSDQSQNENDFDPRRPLVGHDRSSQFDKRRHESVEWDESAIASLESKHEMVSSPSMKDKEKTVTRADKKVAPAIHAGGSTTANHQQRRSNMLVVDDDEESGPELTSSARSFLDEDSIHPSLRAMYKELPWINSLTPREFCGYSKNLGSFEGFKAVEFGSACDIMSPGVRKKLLRATGFVSSPPIYSPVRVSLDGFRKGWDCIRVPLSSGNYNAVFVTTGLCLESYLTKGAPVGEVFVRQIHLQPFENDFQILQANLGAFFGADLMHAPGKNDCLIYQTKKQGWTPPKRYDNKQRADTSSISSSPYSSPRKSGRGVDQSDSSQQSIYDRNVLRPGGPSYRMFEDGIPVYDGRTTPSTRGFRFMPKEWEDYTSLPRYSRDEIASGSLVVVAYTTSSFKLDDAPFLTVHFNALFAIVLGDISIP